MRALRRSSSDAFHPLQRKSVSVALQHASAVINRHDAFIDEEAGQLKSQIRSI